MGPMIEVDFLGDRDGGRVVIRTFHDRTTESETSRNDTLQVGNVHCLCSNRLEVLSGKDVQFGEMLQSYNG